VCTRLKRNRIGASALLGNKAADVQGKSGGKEYCAKNPSKCPMHEARWNKPFQGKRRDDWQNE
jgi:hypothetical protein